MALLTYLRDSLLFAPLFELVEVAPLLQRQALLLALLLIVLATLEGTQLRVHEETCRGQRLAFGLFAC